MESSSGGDAGGIGLECGVGTIVWVRRRNGSWWPGRILGSDELSASHLMSPRSGTPVKLLGREDASVDWYNLEKSKRVKAFRCGEFDACIERAEASQGTPIKKREKYARREDAILHALELEKQQLGLQQQKLGTTTYVISNKTTGSHRNEPANLYSTESGMSHDDHDTHRNMSSHRPQNILTKTDFSQEDENLNGSSYANNRSNKQFRWEDNSEAIPRMRGLQDFGLRTAQSKRKLSQFVNWQKSGKPVDNHVEVLSGSGCMLEDEVHASSSKNSVAVKRKRSQNRLVEECLIKKRDRRRPLVQVLQSSAKLAPHLFQCSYTAVGISMPEEKDQMQSICKAKRSRCVYLSRDSDEPTEHDSELVLVNQFGTNKCLDNPIDVVEGCISSGLIEANDSDSSGADYLEADMREVENMLTDTAHVLVPGSKDCEPPEFQVPEKFRRLNDDEMHHSGIISQLQEHITDASADVGVSKWHMKGKRNTRNIGKRPMDAGDGKIYSAENCNGSMNEMTYESKGNSLNIEIAELSKQKAQSWGIYSKRESLYTCDEDDLIHKDLADNQLNIYGDWRNPATLQTTKDDGQSNSSLTLNDSDNNSHGLTPSIWEADGLSNLAHSAFWDKPVEHFHPVYTGHNELEHLLVDVDLKVEASYQGEHVPLVSLMSRLNGKAIIGHPVQIEILESGSTVHLVSKFDSVTDETAAPPPVWRTARRTAMQRVPRVNPLTAAAEDEEPDVIQFSEHGSKTPTTKKAYSVYLNHQARLAKKSRQSQSKKFQKKNSKRLTLSNQKTRTLSSLATYDKVAGVKLSRSNDMLEGLIKPEGLVPLVACVPVKVVFSRLLEAVGKPSPAAAHRVRMNSPAVRAPS